MNDRADFSLRWKENPFSPIYLTTLLFSTGLLVILPFMEELWRCYRDRARQRIASAKR
jgi:hypothetical protein